MELGAKARGASDLHDRLGKEMAGASHSPPAQKLCWRARDRGPASRHKSVDTLGGDREDRPRWIEVTRRDARCRGV